MYDKEEFLIDADVEFFKVKELLKKNPRMLKDDPLMSLDYLKILKLIKRTHLVEETSDPFNPRDSVDQSYYDLERYQDRQQQAQEEELVKFEKEMALQGGTEGGDKLSLENEDEEQTVRQLKKQEMKDKQKMVK